MLTEKQKLLRKANLPKPIKIDLITQQQLQELEKTLTQEEYDVVLKIFDFLNQYAYSFEKKDKKYQFGLPECYFDFENDEIFNIDLPEFNEELERTRLNPTQLEELYKNGIFEVQSFKFQNNYKWQINEYLFEGRENSKEKFRSHSGFAHSLLIRTKRLYSFSKSLYMLNKQQFYSTNLWSSLFQIPALICNIFDLIFGFPYFQTQNNINQQIIISINKEKYKQIYEENYQGLIDICLYLQNVDNKFMNQSQIKEENKKIYQNQQQILTYHNNNLKAWNQERTSLIDKIDDIEEKEYQFEIQQIDASKIEFINKTFLDYTKELPQNLSQLLYNIFLSYKIKNQIEHEQTLEIQKINKEIPEKIKKENPYLSKVYFWFHHEQKVQLKNEKKNIKKKFQLKYIQQLEKHNLLEIKSLYEFTIDLQHKLKHNKNFRYENAQQIQKPCQENVKNLLLPPYEVEKKNNSYHFKKYNSISVDTSSYFWKLKLLLIQWFIWSKNLSQYTLCYSLFGEYGLKGLFYCHEYYLGYSVNHKTGEVKNDQDKQIPILRKFINCCEGISKSRNNFETTPDNALFGKNISRIFNYIECYIFRFLIVGLFIILFLHPIFNIFMICLLLILGLFSYIWVGILLVIQFLWRIFFYDYNVFGGYNYHLDLKYKKNKLDFLLQRNRSFPIIQIGFKFIIFGIVQFAHIIFLTFFYPLLSILLFILSIIRYILKYCFDSLTYFLIIKPLAKIPQRNTNHARKIAGPGVSQNLFYSLKFEDCIQLGLAELDKIRLDNYKKAIEEYLDKNYLEINKITNKLFSNILTNYRLKNIDNKIISDYKGCLNQEVSERLQQLKLIKSNIHSYKLKFTDKELQKIKISMKELLQNNLVEYQIQKHIWKYFNVKEGQYIRLTSIFLKNVFEQSSISEQSIEQYEEEIVFKKLKKSSYSKKRAFISNTIKGDVLLENYVPQKITKNKQQNIFINNMDIQQTINQINNLNLEDKNPLQFNIWMIRNLKIENENENQSFISQDSEEKNITLLKQQILQNNFFIYLIRQYLFQIFNNKINIFFIYNQ